MSTNYVIFDCDGGSDDAWGLLLLLKAEEEKRITLLGITICGSGNTNLHNAAKNMLRILKTTGRAEIPIFLGAEDALVGLLSNETQSTFHGKDGFGDVLPQDDDIKDIEDFVETEHAVAAINQFCHKHPKLVTVISVGPLTNIALCYSMYSQKFANNIKQIYLMGGNYQGVGNVTRTAEFNTYRDPEAAYIVLSRSKCPITKLPWETCSGDRFSIPIEWRLNVFGHEAAHTSPAIRMLNTVEYAQFVASGQKSWTQPDSLLVAIFLFGSHFIRKQRKWNATVELAGHYTRGQMVLDHLNENPKNVNVIELLDPEVFKQIVRWSVGLCDIKDF